LGQANVAWFVQGWPNGPLQLQAAHSRKCAQVDNVSATNGANISQWTCDGRPHFVWDFVPAGDGYFFIRNRATGKCMHVNGASLANGANITQWDCGVNQSNVKWRTVPRLVRVVKGVHVGGAQTDGGAAK